VRLRGRLLVGDAENATLTCVEDVWSITASRSCVSKVMFSSLLALPETMAGTVMDARSRLAVPAVSLQRCIRRAKIVSAVRFVIMIFVKNAGCGRMTEAQEKLTYSLRRSKTHPRLRSHVKRVMH
jgi:hypothetical protein